MVFENATVIRESLLNILQPPERIQADSHIPYHAPAVPCRAYSHMPCYAPAVLRQCRVLCESPRVAGKIRTANRETPRGSRKKPNLGRSPTGSR